MAKGKRSMWSRFIYISIAVTSALIFAVITNCEDNGINYENLSPNRPYDPVPDDAAANQAVDIQLYWSCSDPDGDPLVYELFFGVEGNPPLVASDLVDTTYNPGQLQHNTTYYWRIKAHDPRISRTGPIWSFTTESQ